MGLWEKVKRAAAAIAIGGAITYLGWLSVPTDRAPQAKTKAEEIIANNSNLELFLTDTSPNGKKIAFQGRVNKKKPYDIYVYDLNDKTLENITQSTDKNESSAKWLDNETFKYNYLDVSPNAYFKFAWKNIRTGETGSTPNKDSTLWMMLTGMFAAPLIALWGVGYLRKRRNQSIINYLGNNTDFTAGTGFLSTAAFFAAMDSFLWYHPDASDVMRPGYLTMAASHGVIPAIVAGTFGNVKSPCFTNGLKYFKHSFQVLLGSYKKKIDAVEQLKNISINKTPYEIEHAQIAIKNNYLDEGLNALKRGLENIVGEVTTHQLKTPFAWPIIKLKHRLERKNPATQLTDSLIYLIDFDFNRAVSKIEEFAAGFQDSDRLTARALYLQSLKDSWHYFKRLAPKKTAEFEQRTSLTELTYSAWDKAISTILTSKNPKWKLMGESRNEVMETESTQFLKSTYVFKRCAIVDRARLKQERENILYLKKEFGDQIPQSLAYIEHGEHAYHVLLHKNNNTFENEITKNPDNRYRHLLNAIIFLQKLQSHGLPDCEKPPEGSIYYRNRLATVFCDQLKRSGADIPVEVYDSLEETSERTYSALKNAPMALYKDANLRNWLVTSEKDITAIDFEHKILLPVQFDLVNLLEFAQIPDRERDSLVNVYFRSKFGDKRSSNDFAKEYKFAAMHKHLELAGYRARDKEWGAVEYHIESSRKYADEVGELKLASSLDKVVLPLQS